MEQQKWEEEKQGFIRKIEDLQHELTILEGRKHDKERNKLHCFVSFTHSLTDSLTH